MEPETRKTAAEQDYFGLLDIDEETVRDAMDQCPNVFWKLGE